MSEPAIQKLHHESRELIEFLNKHTEISLRISAENHFAKALVLAAASRFEKNMTSTVLELAKQCLTADHPLVTLIRQMAVERQYHKWFEWNGKNANKFFGLFGKNFKECAQRAIDEDAELDKSLKSFLELGNYRNRLIHNDFVTFQLDKSLEEIYQLYEEASRFVEWFQQVARDGLRVPLSDGQSIPEDVAHPV